MRNDFRLSPQQKDDAREALRTLEGSGFSLQQAALLALSGRRVEKRVTFSEAYNAFMRTRIKLRAASYAWYEEKLKPFEHLADTCMSDITRSDVAEVINNLESKNESTRCSHARAARALWNFCINSCPAMAINDVTRGLAACTDDDHLLNWDDGCV